MKQLPKISDTEWEVMKALWAKAPSTSEEVIAALKAETDENWHPKTVRTLLGRLVKKKAVEFKRDGRAYQYTPLVSQDECVHAESSSFLGRIFSGAVGPLLLHFVNHEKLTPSEIAELKEMLDRRKS